MISRLRKTIGMFISKSYSFFDNTAFRVIQREAKRMNYDVVVFTTVGNRTTRSHYDIQEKGIFDFAPVEQLDGIIVVPDSYETEGFLDALHEMLETRVTCPVVAVRHNGTRYDCTFTDDDAAIRQVLSHLIDAHGLTKIAFLAGFPGHADGEQRLRTYRSVMAERGLPMPEGAVFYGNMWYTCVDEAYKHFFVDSPNRPQAVVCANDFMAIGLMKVLRKHGIRVPEDVIVTGFDNIPGLAVDEPTLTTIEPDFAGMVVQAMAHLDRQIRGGKREGLTRMRLSGKLVLGESCGCCKRPADYFERLSRTLTDQMENMREHERFMTYLSVDLTACEDLVDMHQVLIDKMNELIGVRDLYLCLFAKERTGSLEPAFAKDMTDTACLVHAVRDRQDHGMPMIRFDWHTLLPPMAERVEEPQMFFIKLLHQKEYTYGYAAYQYFPGEIPSEFFQQWNVFLSGALQNIHKREELRVLYEERRLSSITDVMTGLLNRRGLVEKIAPQWPHLCASREKVVFVNFDLDGLKQINDTYGHAAGDYAICTVARAIQAAAPKNAISARLGGDEFLTFLPEADTRSARRFVADFDRSLHKLNAREKRSFDVSASYGYAVITLESHTTIDRCIQTGDDALYRAKELRHAQRRESGKKSGSGEVTNESLSGKRE